MAVTAALSPSNLPQSAQSDTPDRPHFAARSGIVRPLAAGGAVWLGDGSCMSREAKRPQDSIPIARAASRRFSPIHF